VVPRSEAALRLPGQLRLTSCDSEMAAQIAHFRRLGGQNLLRDDVSDLIDLDTEVHLEPPGHREPFEWEFPRGRQPESHLQLYEELNEELRLNEQRQYSAAMDESTHTVFQEQAESSWPPRDASLTPIPLAGVDEYDPPPQLMTNGYMHSDSPFALETNPVNEMSFMEWYPRGSATLTYPGHNGTIESIPYINLFMIETRCPLIAAAFEDSRSGPQLHLETLTRTTAYPFLRYLYTGSYSLATASGDYFKDVPTSVLLHCQLYHLANIYDLDELKTQSYVNVLRQCEFGCSSPEKPIDLCAGIHYIYKHLGAHDNLIDAIVNYCVSNFKQHHLDEDADFMDLAYELRAFHQALCRNSMSRQFENESKSCPLSILYSLRLADRCCSCRCNHPHAIPPLHSRHLRFDGEANQAIERRCAL
jgi:hypothetical protein